MAIPSRALTAASWRSGGPVQTQTPPAEQPDQNTIPRNRPNSWEWRDGQKTSAQRRIMGTEQRYGPSRWEGQDAQPRQPARKSQSKEPSSPAVNDPHAQQAMAEGRRLYVGNMPYMAKMADVESLFTKGGYEVQRIDISIDPFTSRSPGYCFVELASRGEADRAMKDLDGASLLYRPVKIRPGVPKSKQGAPLTAERRAETALSATNYSGHDCRLYVGGLPRMPNHSAVEAAIRELFREFNLTAISKLISPGPESRKLPGDHYFLFVEFASVQEAEAAVEAIHDKKIWSGGSVRVKRAEKQGSWKVKERQHWDETRGKFAEDI